MSKIINKLFLKNITELPYNKSMYKEDFGQLNKIFLKNVLTKINNCLR